jgi:hypothetical protein
VPFQDIQKIRLCVSAASENPHHLDFGVPEVGPGGNLVPELAAAVTHGLPSFQLKPAGHSSEALFAHMVAFRARHSSQTEVSKLAKEGIFVVSFRFFGCLVKEAVPKAKLVTGLERLIAAQAAVLPAAVAAAAATAAAAMAAAPAAAAAAIAAASYTAAAAIAAAAGAAAFAE